MTDMTGIWNRIPVVIRAVVVGLGKLAAPGSGIFSNSLTWGAG